MKGLRRAADSRTASAASKSTLARRSRFDGSLASAHGAASAMKALVASMIRNAAAAPSWIARASMAVL